MIDGKLGLARLPSLMDVFQQLLLLFCICAHTSDSQLGRNCLRLSLPVAGHNNDCRGMKMANTESCISYNINLC